MLKPVNFRQNGSTPITANLPSPALWDSCPFLELKEGHLNGFAVHDDMEFFGLPGTQTTEIQNGNYKVYNTGAGKVQVDTMPHAATGFQTRGIISMLTDTDGDQSVIGTQSCPLSFGNSIIGRAWFEARIAVTSILTNMGQLFCGLAENSTMTFGAATPLANNDATATTGALLGFNRLEDGLAVLNTSYADHAAAWTNVQASANTTLVANTWIKLGIMFDPKGDPLRCVRFFVDNVECTSAITRTAFQALTYCNTVGLGPCLAFFADSAGTANYVYLDWWRWAQLYE